MTRIIGTTTSGTFLYITAILIIILADVMRVFREMHTGRYRDGELEEQLKG